MKKKLLIVDDSLFVYEEMKHILAKTNYEIAGYAKNGEDAIKLYEELQPDIVTLDIIMPGIDGLETAKILLEKWKDAKIVIISSLAYDETMEHANSIGVSGFIFKPIEENELIHMLNQIS